jgi:metal-responsive CopG/Arc/MetJ family transcriptional regulator
MRKSITISKDLNEDIKDYCKTNGITNSQLIETATRTYLTLYKASKDIAERLSEAQPKMKNKKG